MTGHAGTGRPQGFHWRRAAASEEMEGGRGLTPVGNLARQWNWYAPVQMGGKIV